MNANSIKYHLIIHWFEKKLSIIVICSVLCTSVILFCNLAQKYQILLKDIYNIMNQSNLFSIMLFITVLYIFLTDLISIKFYTKSNNSKLSSNNYQKNENQLQDLFQFSPIGSAIIDLNTDCFIDANFKFCALLDYTPAEIKGQQISMIFPNLFSSNSYSFTAIENRNITGYSTEMELLSQLGKKIWVKLTISPSYKKEAPSYISNIFIEDISSKKNAIYNQMILKDIKGIEWECNVESLQLLFISNKIKSILGYSAKELMQKNNFWNEITHPNDFEHITKTFRLAVHENIIREIEFRMIAKNEETVWIRAFFCFNNENHACIKGIMTDISKIKKNEKELKKMIRLVTEQNKKLISFSHIVSHNLRSHSSNIESISNFISSSKSVVEQEQMIQLLKLASNSLNQTVFDLNHVVNVKTKINLVYKTLNLKQYIIDAEKVLVDQIQSSDTTIENLIPPTVMINYNPACLESILYNLISNALRFQHPDRKPIITIKWTSTDSKNILEISDNGIGIDLTKNADKIFGMYNTFHKNTKSKGMGLFTTKNQIEAMGGSISVESMVNIGTTFKINL